MATNESRIALIQISKIAKERQETDLEGMSINEILVHEFYTDSENTEFNTFHQWKIKGMNIIKGSKAFLVWGKKRDAKEQQEQPKQEQQQDEESNYKFFPVCYLFSNKQVQPKNNKND